MNILLILITAVLAAPFYSLSQETEDSKFIFALVGIHEDLKNPQCIHIEFNIGEKRVLKKRGPGKVLVKSASGKVFYEGLVELEKVPGSTIRCFQCKKLNFKPYKQFRIVFPYTTEKFFIEYAKDGKTLQKVEKCEDHLSLANKRGVVRTRDSLVK